MYWLVCAIHVKHCLSNVQQKEASVENVLHIETCFSTHICHIRERAWANSIMDSKTKLNVDHQVDEIYSVTTIIQTG